jgi:hypothetical protein
MEDLLKLQYYLSQDRVQAALEMSKRGGHLWIFLATPLLAKECRIYIHDLAQRLGVPVKGAGLADGIEVFPKHDAIGPGDFGDAIRGPLGIHRSANRRFWFYGADYTLEAQVEYLKKLRKVTEEQLRAFIAGKEPPHPQVVSRPTKVCGLYSGSWITWEKSAKLGGIMSHAARPALTPVTTGAATTAILIEDPRFYQCWAGCTKEMIRNALGFPIRVRNYV